VFAFFRTLRTRTAGFVGRRLTKLRIPANPFPAYPGARIIEEVKRFHHVQEGDSGRKSLLELVLGGDQFEQLRGRVTIEGPPEIFASGLVRCLYQYDRSNPKSTVVDLLEFMKQGVGVEQQSRLSDLIAEYTAYRNAFLGRVIPDPGLGLRQYRIYAYLFLLVVGLLTYWATRPEPLSIVEVWPPKYHDKLAREPMVFVTFNKPVTPDAKLILKPTTPGPESTKTSKDRVHGEGLDRKKAAAGDTASSGNSPESILPEKLPEGALASRTLAFQAKRLKCGTNYRVTLEGVKSERGETMPLAECEWSYTSEEGHDQPPEFHDWSIVDKTESGLLPLRPKIKVYFNAPVVSGDYELAKVVGRKVSSTSVAKGRLSLEPSLFSSKHLFIDTNHYGKLEPQTEYELKVNSVSDEYGNKLEAIADPYRFKTVAVAGTVETPISFQDLSKKRTNESGAIAGYEGKLVRWTGTVISFPEKTTILLGDKCDGCLKSTNFSHTAIFRWHDDDTFPIGLKEGASICLEGILRPNKISQSFLVWPAEWSSCR
jgi:Effector-associated domain 8